MIRRLLPLLMILAGVAPVAQGQPPPNAGSNPPRPGSIGVAVPGSECAVSTDPDYAYTFGKPVRIGGGPDLMVARQQRYLSALRGPGGEPVQYRRIGALPVNPPNATTFIDQYEVTYQGLEKPKVLHLDAYRFEPLPAPAGFICGAYHGLGPVVDGRKEMASIPALAATVAAGREVGGIPIGSDGSATHGVMFDRFRLLQGEARAGVRRDSAFGQVGSVVVAFPISCAGQAAVAPTAIEIDGPRGPLRRAGEYVSGERIAALLPGIDATVLPAGALAAGFLVAQLRPNETVTVRYASPACGTDGVARHPVTFTPSRELRAPQPTARPGVPLNPAQMFVQTLVDVDGTLQRPEHVGGPIERMPQAIEALSAWQFEPARTNGAPIVTSTVVMLVVW